MFRSGVSILVCWGMVITVGCDNDNGSGGFGKGSSGDNTVVASNDTTDSNTSAPIHDTTVATEDTVVVATLPEIVGECGGVVTYHPKIASKHLADDDHALFDSHPPTSGPHYTKLAKWGAYDKSVPPGHWVHNMEHGGIVLLYRTGADAEKRRATLIQVAGETPADPKCTGTNEACQRIIVAPDDQLPSGTAVAAVAWEYLYTAECASAADLRSFIDARYAKAPEDFCGGTSYLPDEATLATFGPCSTPSETTTDVSPIHGDVSSGESDGESETDGGNLPQDSGSETDGGNLPQDSGSQND